MPRKTIVHVSCDYPDPIAAAKTPAAIKLVSGTPGYRHVVYSLNRTSWASGVAAFEFGADRLAIAYGAPPGGLLLETRLNRVADFILADLAARGVCVDLLHLHKFSAEGLVGLRMVRALNCPFVVSIWGDSDLKIVGARRDLRGRWRAVAEAASLILPCAPWAAERLGRLLPIDPSKVVVLPCIAQNGAFSPAPIVDAPRLVSVFHLDSFRRKNFALLVEAVARLARSRPDIRLDIYGRGSAATLLTLRRILRSAGAEDVVSLAGPVTGETLGAVLRGYAAFVMPTRRETFGMVYIEALFAGLPVLTSRGWGIDGFFEPDEIGYACDPTRVDDIVRGVEVLLDRQGPLKRRIAALHRAGRFQRFETRRILETYGEALERALGVSAGRESTAVAGEPEPSAVHLPRLAI